MVEFKSTNYFIGFWFVGGTDQDWLACVYREQGQTDWRLVHRFRYPTVVPAAAVGSDRALGCGGAVHPADFGGRLPGVSEIGCH